MREWTVKEESIKARAFQKIADLIHAPHTDPEECLVDIVAQVAQTEEMIRDINACANKN